MQLLENAGAIPYLQIRMYKKARQIKGDYYFSSFYDLFFYSFENNQLLFCCQNFHKKKTNSLQKTMAIFNFSSSETLRKLWECEHPKINLWKVHKD